MKHNKTPLNKSKVYKNFIAQRDHVLEVIHTKTQAKVSDVLRGTFDQMLHTIIYYYSRHKTSPHILNVIGAEIQHKLLMASQQITRLMQDMRKDVYLLANAGEAEAISRAVEKPLHVHVGMDKLSKIVNAKTFTDSKLSDRVNYVLQKLGNKIVDAVHLSIIQDDDVETLEKRVLTKLPTSKNVKQPRKILKPFKEARAPIGNSPQGQNVTLNSGFIDDADWQDMLDEYQSEFIPVNRGPEKLDLNLGEGTPQYTWELEQEITQDFVNNVRQGQVDAANENGYTDFVWVAIVDNRTDECCLWRDGLTTKEIELALQNEHSDDDCDAIVPPAHFNCRCSLAPVTDALPDQPELNIGDFSAWLDKTSL